MRKLLFFLLFIPFFCQAQYISGCGPYSNSGAITLTSNSTVSGKLIDLSNANTVAITGNNVTNVHITKCKIINTQNFAIKLNNCSNITIDSCYFNNVGFGVYAQNGTITKVNGNYFLNINGVSTAFLGHAVQFDNVNGGGNQINNNRVENINGVAIHPHDMLNVYQSNGIPGDSIQVIGNWIRGGQYTAWPNSSSTGAGIIMGDVSGSYQVCRNNIMVNSGCAGIQCNGNSPHIKIDHNQVFGTQSPVSAQGIIVENNNQIELSYNQVNWTNSKGLNVLLSDGETQYYLSNSPKPINLNTNTWQAKISASILPASLIPSCTPTTAKPNITYSPTIYQFTTGVSAAIGAPKNTGGSGTFTVSPSLPTGLVLSQTGAISGVPVSVSNGTYTVTCTNTAGSSSVLLQIIVSVPVIQKPNISYNPNSIVTTVGSVIVPLTPVNTGGAIASWGISPALPSNLTFANGVISGQALVTQANTAYTVSATNTGGTSTAVVNIQVNSQPPLTPHISYPSTSYALTQNSSITITPTNSGGVGLFSVSSGILPAGLILNPTTGVIQGSALTTQAPGNIVITCTNATGSSPFTISFAVNSSPSNHYYLIGGTWFGPVFY